MIIVANNGKITSAFIYLQRVRKIKQPRSSIYESSFSNIYTVHQSAEPTSTISPIKLRRSLLHSTYFTSTFRSQSITSSFSSFSVSKRAPRRCSLAITSFPRVFRRTFTISRQTKHCTLCCFAKTVHATSIRGSNSTLSAFFCN